MSLYQKLKRLHDRFQARWCQDEIKTYELSVYGYHKNKDAKMLKK